MWPIHPCRTKGQACFSGTGYNSDDDDWTLVAKESGRLWLKSNEMADPTDVVGELEKACSYLCEVFTAFQYNLSVLRKQISSIADYETKRDRLIDLADSTAFANSAAQSLLKPVNSGPSVVDSLHKLLVPKGTSHLGSIGMWFSHLYQTINRSIMGPQRPFFAIRLRFSLDWQRN